MDALLVLCTCPDDDRADAIARALVEESLAACVNRMPVRSVYRWKGRVDSADEALLIVKTTRSGYEALRERLLALHPYELPEVVAVDVAAGHAPYLEWIAAGVRSPA